MQLPTHDDSNSCFESHDQLGCCAFVVLDNLANARRCLRLSGVPAAASSTNVSSAGAFGEEDIGCAFPVLGDCAAAVTAGLVPPSALEVAFAVRRSTARRCLRFSVAPDSARATSSLTGTSAPTDEEREVLGTTVAAFLMRLGLCGGLLSPTRTCTMQQATEWQQG